MMMMLLLANSLIIRCDVDSPQKEIAYHLDHLRMAIGNDNPIRLDELVDNIQSIPTTGVRPTLD